MMRLGLVFMQIAGCLALLQSCLACSSDPIRTRATASAGHSAAPTARAAPTPADVSGAGSPGRAPDTAVAGKSALPSASTSTRAPATPERVIPFAYRPAGASDRVYAMRDPEDRHQILLTEGIEPGKGYPIVIALHGQPRRGIPPREYHFPHTVADVVRELVASGEIAPVVLVTPVFRFEGENWPDFDLRGFLRALDRQLKQAGIARKDLFVVGHSGAAGCGGGGLNHAASIAPRAVGFFDTCVGPGFAQALRELAAKKIRTLIAHSVETAGVRPRPRLEYDAEFDYGKVYSPVGLRPVDCPSRLPEAPLREQPYRCAGNAAGTTLALVVDTGRGDEAHEALVPVAFRYFLREYLPGASTPAEASVH